MEYRIRNSGLFLTLCNAHSHVDVWNDEGFGEGGYSYFWIVSKFEPGSVRNLAYVRILNDRLEQRTYGEAGDDQWVSVN